MTSPADAAGHAVAAPLSAASAEIYATLPRRLVAGAVDVAIVHFTCGVVGLVWGVIHVLTNALDEFNEHAANAVLLNHLGVAMLAGLLAGMFYTAWFESSRRRATPGKMLMGIFVTDVEGRRIGFARALARHLGKFLSILALGIGYVQVLLSRRRQAMHDRIAGTVVLRK